MGAVQSIVSTQLPPSSTLAVRTQSSIRTSTVTSDTDQTDKNSWSIEIPAQENLLQKHKERVENLPQPDQLIKICTDAGFLNASDMS